MNNHGLESVYRTGEITRQRTGHQLLARHPWLRTSHAY